MRTQTEICHNTINGDKMKLDHTALPDRAKAHLKANGWNTDPYDSDEPSRVLLPRAGKDGVVMNSVENGHGLDGAPVLTTALGMALQASPTKTLSVDVEKYQAWLDDPALSDEHKEQIVHALWQIIVCFVDLGFGVSPLDDACGQLQESEGFCGPAGQDVVSSEAHTLSETFNNIAAE